MSLLTYVPHALCSNALTAGLMPVQAGAALSVRSVISICVPLFATSYIGSYGTVALATNELMRQLYIGSLTLLAGFDISAQALVASYLGQASTLPVCAHGHAEGRPSWSPIGHCS